jgi:hypothetical protein
VAGQQLSLRLYGWVAVREATVALGPKWAQTMLNFDVANLSTKWHAYMTSELKGIRRQMASSGLVLDKSAAGGSASRLGAHVFDWLDALASLDQGGGGHLDPLVDKGKGSLPVFLPDTNVSTITSNI